MRWILPTVAVSVFATVAQGSPFGINMGEPINDLGQVVKNADSRFELKAPPNPHSEFKEYYVTATPETGVCAVEAATPGIYSGLDQTFKKIKGQLDTKYGRSSALPFSWEAPYGFVWNKESGSDLKDRIERITLSERSSMKGEQFVFIQYFFDNFAECDKVVKKPLEDMLAKMRKAAEERAKGDSGAL